MTDLHGRVRWVVGPGLVGVRHPNSVYIIPCLTQCAVLHSQIGARFELLEGTSPTVIYRRFHADSRARIFTCANGALIVDAHRALFLKAVIVNVSVRVEATQTQPAGGCVASSTIREELHATLTATSCRIIVLIVFTFIAIFDASTNSELEAWVRDDGLSLIVLHAALIAHHRKILIDRG